MAMILTRLKYFKIPTLHMCLSFNYGEHLLSIDWKERMKLFKLTPDQNLNYFNRFQLSHNSIHQSPISDSTLYFTTSYGLITIRRPTLEEYVLHMKRGPTITYPKDIWAVIGLLDIGPGSRVMEAGSGSGALTLHLSRLVSESGKVISFENTEKHLIAAKESVMNWAESLRCAGKSDKWTHNVEFHLNDVNQCTDIINDPVDAVVLDLVECRSVLENVVKVTKQNGIIALYVTNISQVINIIHYLTKSYNIPLSCESVNEFTRKLWTVKPALLKNKKFSSYLIPNRDTNSELVSSLSSDDNNTTQSINQHTSISSLDPAECNKPLQDPAEGTTPSQDPAEGATPSQDPVEGTIPSQDPAEGTHSSPDPIEDAIPLSQDQTRAIKFQDMHDFGWNKKGFPNYIARPSHQQDPHTAFIVKLRRL